MSGGRGKGGVPLRVEFGVESDVGFEETRDGAAGFRFGGDIVEFGLVDIRDFRGKGEMGFGHGPTGGRNLLERDVGARFDAVGREPGFAEHGGEGHRETPGVGGGDELFGVGAGAVFEAGAEGVGSIVERAAGGGEGAFALFEGAVPDGGCSAFHGAGNVGMLRRFASGSRALLFGGRHGVALGWPPYDA